MTTPNTPIIQFEQKGPVVLATVREARMLDALNVAEFGRQLTEFVQNRERLNLLICFEHVDYLSSAVLTELLRVNSIVTKYNGSVRLCSLQSSIQEVFQITSLDKVFVIYSDDDGEQASKKFQRSLQLAAEEKSWEGLRVDE